MKNWEDGLAVAVIGTAIFQVATMWQNTAPSLADCRAKESGDLSTKQKLVDADVMVGAVALLAGVALAVMTKDVTAMILILTTYGVLALYYHQVLAAPAR